MLEYGPSKLNLCDLCTLIPPKYNSNFESLAKVNNESFVSGWLVDKVSKQIIN